VKAVRKKRKTDWRQLALAGAVALQLVLFSGDVAAWGRRLWGMRGMPPIQRAALQVWDASFAGYVMFLRRETPAHAKIIIPPHTGPLPANNVGLMQYFLFPREIHNCGPAEIPACVERAKGPDTYLLRVDDFPPHGLAIKGRVRLDFNEQYGLYAPAESD
jgi:hypothetical protein